MALENQVIVTDSTLNVAVEMFAIDAVFATRNFPARFAKTTYLQSSVPAAQLSTIQEGPPGTFHLAHRTARF